MCTFKKLEEIWKTWKIVWKNEWQPWSNVQQCIILKDLCYQVDEKVKTLVLQLGCLSIKWVFKPYKLKFNFKHDKGRTHLIAGTNYKWSSVIFTHLPLRIYLKPNCSLVISPNYLLPTSLDPCLKNVAQMKLRSPYLV